MYNICLSAQFWCRLPIGNPMPAILIKFALDLCTLSWWVQLVHFVTRVSGMPSESLHHDIPRYAVSDAFAKPSVGNWAARSSNNFGLCVCLRPLLMMARFPLTSPAFVLSLLANIMGSGTGCILPQGLRLSRGQNCARITGGLHALGLCLSLLSLALE